MKRLTIAASAVAGLFAATSAQAQQVPEDMTNIGVGQDILETVSRQLPESQAVGAEFLNEAYYPSLRLDDASHLAVTFVSEGAGYRNSVGYFTYQDNAFDGLTFGDIDINGSGNIGFAEMQSSGAVDDMGVLFSNFSGAGSGGLLQAGDTTVIGGGSINLTDDSWTMTGDKIFEAGTNVGFFLIANGWNGSGVNGVDNLQDHPSFANGKKGNGKGVSGKGVNSLEDNPTYWSMDFLNPENDADATVDDVSRNTRHLAMLNVVDANQVVVGFEDLNRLSGDNDFNDAVFIVRSDPADALQNSNIPKVSAAPVPALGAGVGGLAMAIIVGFGAVRRGKSA
ncbi:DUF4114 domain-containing protein [Minwuia sp. IMCC3077]|uniref:DUF4114 domain-containing protein n=1 Tax=Minwuia sp. IMCC3077 TaxID=3040676 RepID=UPI00247B0DBE|nr:DUF4114 domain-containing protein [Minwuia sp. IMCC3077]